MSAGHAADATAALSRVRGCLLGIAVGDAVGLPAEGCARKTVARRFAGPWRHRLVWGHGMLSDDTEHAFRVGQALLAADGDVEQFRRHLARGLRWWIAAIPAGVGLATAKACLRLWLGWSPSNSGVVSAGNGGCMRAPLLGAHFADDPTARRAHTDASTRITHRDPRALTAARAIAELTADLATNATGEAASDRARVAMLRQLAPEDLEWCGLMDAVAAHLRDGSQVDDLATHLGLARGITGYAYHTVPMVVFAVLRHPDEPRAALEALWNAGGDTDTTGAIAGGILGAAHGARGWPAEWLTGIRDWPLGRTQLERCAAALANGGRPVRWFWPAAPLRNLVFLAVVLAHGLRRLLPF